MIKPTYFVPASINSQRGEVPVIYMTQAYDKTEAIMNIIEKFRNSDVLIDPDNVRMEYPSYQ